MFYVNFWCNEQIYYHIKIRVSTSGLLDTDKRGKSIPANKTPKYDIDMVSKNISLTPSHYTLSRSYNGYKLWLPEKRKPVV